MAQDHAWACFLIVWIITATDGKIPDVQVICLFSENCILPCSFKPIGNNTIQWYKQEVSVHSFMEGEDQLDQQHYQYAGRTSLFKDQVEKGNASLHLQQCTPKDRGRYRCLVNSGRERRESFIIVKVVAPVHSLTLESTWLSGYEELKCSARDVYPAPHMSWSTRPPIPTDAFISTTRKTADSRGLYTVESKLKRVSNRSDLCYICTLNSSYGAQRWRASLRKREMTAIEGQDLIIPCEAPEGLQNFLLTWSYTRSNDPAVILTYDSRTHQSSNRWEDRAKLDINRAKVGDATLRIFKPEKEEHTGAYTCLFSAFQNRHLVHTEVNFTTLIGRSGQVEHSPKWWIAAIVIAVLAITAAAVVGVLKLRDQCSQSDRNIEEAVVIQSNKHTTDGGIPSESSPLTVDQVNEHT